MDYDEAKIRMFGVDDSLKDIVKSNPYVVAAIKVYQEEHYQCISKQKVREAIEICLKNGWINERGRANLLEELGL